MHLSKQNDSLLSLHDLAKLAQNRVGRFHVCYLSRPNHYYLMSHRSYIQEKRDNRRRTGTGGGKTMVYSENDEIIFRIIGTESKTLDGLHVHESSGTSSAVLLEPIHQHDSQDSDAQLHSTRKQTRVKINHPHQTKDRIVRCRYLHSKKRSHYQSGNVRVN